ncbi:MAG: terminase [Prevotella sp.]|nr:terminase [Prevotella sp.]
MSGTVNSILEENERRRARLFAVFNPITGQGSILNRERVVIDDYDLPVQWLPLQMLKVPLVERVANAGSIAKYITDCIQPSTKEEGEALRAYASELLTRIRRRYDFAFWCAELVTISNKTGGEEIPFCLNSPQRKLAAVFEEQRLGNVPIRVIIDKARQWGGSTLTQIYIAWLQLVREKGLNSLIVAQVLDTANTIKAMFRRVIANYPTEALYPIGEKIPFGDVKFRPVGNSRNITHIPQRKCNIQIGTAEHPDSCRGSSHTLAHFSEVASWKRTDGKDPEDIVRSAAGGILYKPGTMIVMESTAQRTGDFFHGEWLAAKNGSSQYKPVFVGWHEIEIYRLNIEDKVAFAAKLINGMESDRTESDREEPGRYLWWLWEKGATLEHIAWYIEERKKFSSHDDMAREYPTDDAESFAHTKATVFSHSLVDKFRKTCRPPVMIGELDGKESKGEACMECLHFRKDPSGCLSVWEEPEEDDAESVITDRYLTVVDPGRGISNKADYSVIVVFDRLMMSGGGRPVVVAQWRGRTDMDLLAWRSARIATWYNNSLLVIESNTIESNGGVGANMAGSSYYVLELIGDIYPNLYYREQSTEDIIKHAPRKIGFHTNARTKAAVIESLKRIIREGAYIERDEGTLDEFAVYEQNERGQYAAPPGGHDDRLMTRAIGLYVCFEQMELPKTVKRGARLPHLGRTLTESDF